MRLHGVTRVTRGYKGLQGVTKVRDEKGLPKSYKGLQRGDKGLQRVTEGDKRL